MERFYAVWLIMGVTWGLHLLFLSPKKKEILWEALKRAFLDIGIASAATGLVSLAIALCFHAPTSEGNWYLGILIGIAFMWISPGRYLLRTGRKHPIGRQTVLGLLLVVLILADLFVNNFYAYRTDTPEHVLEKDALEKVETEADFKDGCLYVTSGQTMVFPAGAFAKGALYLDFEPKSAELSIRMDYRTSEGGAWKYYQTFQTNPQYATSAVLALPEGSATQIKLTVKQDMSHLPKGAEPDTFCLRQAVFRYKIPLQIHFFAVSVLFLLILLFVSLIRRFGQVNLRDLSGLRKVEWTILGLTAGIGLLFWLYAVLNRPVYFETYPFSGDLQKKDIYMQLFDAFKKGQVSLDVQPTERLLAAENPYDPALRPSGSALWDHAFYQGKYYCYYGAVPLLFVAFPHYWLTGLVPNVLFMQTVAVIGIVGAVMIATLEFLSLFVKKISVPFTGLSLFCSVFLSLSLMNVTYKVGTYNEGIYHIPEAYGVFFSLWFLIFLLQGYKNEAKRPVWFALAGLTFGALMGTRPNMIMVALVALPLGLGLLIRKGASWKRKLLEFAPMALILILSAALLCWYNYVRFDSIFEFGQGYQLTVADNTKLAYSIRSLWPAVFHFVLQPFAFSSADFPVVTLKRILLGYEGHVYVMSSAGFLCVPAFWPMLALPVAMRKKPAVLKMTLLALAIVPFVLAFTTYCFAGVCIRYLLDFYPLLTILVLTVMAILLEKSSSRPKLYSVLLILFAVLLLAGAFLTFNLLFNGFDGLRVADLDGLLLIVRESFGKYNFLK